MPQSKVFPHQASFRLLLILVLSAGACSVPLDPQPTEVSDGEGMSDTAQPPTPAWTDTPSATLTPAPPPTAEIRGEPKIPADSPFVDGTEDLLPSVVNVNYGIDFADVDGNGSVDLWVADCGRFGDQLLLNDGTGGMIDETSERLSRPDASDQWKRTSFGEDVVFADIDGDGHVDAYINSRPHTPTGNVWAEGLFINDGTGGFTDEIESRLPIEVFWEQGISGLAAFGDVDGDGDVDLLRTTRFHRTTSPDQNGRTGLFLNDGSGFFTEATERLPDDARTHTTGLGLADVNLDGHLDIVLENSPVDANPDSVNELRIYLNDGEARFHDASTELLPAAWREGLNVAKFALGDLENDGDVDIVSSNVILRYDRGSGRFVADHQTPVMEGAGLAVVGDVDGDGFLDIVATQFREVEGEGAHDPVLLLNDGNGGFGRAQTIAEMPPGTIIQEMGVADVDGDGDGDLYVGTGVPPSGQQGMVGGSQLDRLLMSTFVEVGSS